MNRFIDINPERCIGCGTCQSACADAHRMQGLQDTPRLALVKTGGISAALACHHCEGAPCAEVCPVNAIEHDGDRIHVKEQECIGCRLCAIACSFGAIHPDGTSIAGVAGMCDPTPSYPKSLSSLGGAADRELDEAKRLRSIENGPAVDVTAVAQGLSEKAEGSVNNG